jgi:hypothetical protein
LDRVGLLGWHLDGTAGKPPSPIQNSAPAPPSNSLKIACARRHFWREGACGDTLRSRGTSDGRAGLKMEQLHM